MIEFDADSEANAESNTSSDADQVIDDATLQAALNQVIDDQIDSLGSVTVSSIDSEGYADAVDSIMANDLLESTAI